MSNRIMPMSCIRNVSYLSLCTAIGNDVLDPSCGIMIVPLVVVGYSCDFPVAGIVDWRGVRQAIDPGQIGVPFLW